MTDEEFLALAVKSVMEYENEMLPLIAKLHESDIYVAWYCRTIQNYKALLSTPVPDGMYYEFTWNGDKNEGYLDAYKHKESKVITNV